MEDQDNAIDWVIMISSNVLTKLSTYSPLSTRALIQYKDVILPVKESLLWR